MARMTAEEMAGAVEILPAAGGYDPDMAEAFEEFRESLDTSTTDSTIWVHRIPLDERGEMVTNAKHVHLFTAPLDRYKLDEIIAKVKSEYMRPDERIACIRLMAKIAGKRGNAFNKVLLIEKELKPAAPQSESGRENIAEILRAIQENTNAQMAAMRQMFAERTPPPPAKDPLEMAVGLMGVMTNMVATLNKSAAIAAPAPGASLADQIRAMKELKDLAGDLLGDAGGGSGGDDSAVGIIKAVAPLAAPLLQIMAQNRPQTPPRVRPALSAPNAAPDPAQPTPPPVSTPKPAQFTPAPQHEGQKVIAELRTQLIAICEAAAQGADPAHLGAAIVDQLPPESEMETRLLALLDDPLWMQKLCGIHPGVREHAEFFGALRAAILSAYIDDEATPDTPPA